MVDRDSSEAHMSIAASSMFPGFKFCPTDGELISYYLRKKLDGDEDSVQIISELELCTFEPWDLPEKSFIKSNDEWFFFSRRGRKYPNSSQNKRATKSGYWKVTGKERQIESGQNVIGTRRTLVFHVGRVPKGERTEWIIHEYCINDKFQSSNQILWWFVGSRRTQNFIQMMILTKLHARVVVESQKGVTVQRSTCVPIQDKEVGCSSKRSNNSNSSPSITVQIESSNRVANEVNPKASSNESSDRVANEANPKASSNHSKVDEVDYYAEINLDDIINLDEPAL
ncbi:hypothetical protein Ahy_B05g074221 [Arachis hypogaea]|uniref:NAC domain-containing protein n=1 Tax=Arachis hypogaea TaxID=3818 RepID=A0A444YY88_ARAHY|nr:hypothetical protein Ahy_B05g074221 [Arachis hypogaea]